MSKEQLAKSTELRAESKNSKLYANSSKPLRWIELIVVITLVLIYGWATHQRNFVWKDDMTLYLDVVEKSPSKSRAYSSLQVAFMSQGQYREAIEAG